MARTAGVWGIDIGNCALKAMHCHLNREDGTVVADAFDYIEYPNILTEPDIEPGDMVHDALVQFLSRNVIKGDKIAISTAGKNGFIRFIKLPPVETKRIPDLVKYEAKQQIPFDLKEVLWDYQRLGGDKQNDLALEIEIGLFAMKRDSAYSALTPFEDARIPVDFIQLTPLTLYNMAMHNFLTDLPSAEDYDPENPPPSVAFLSIGTDNSDLVITNGFKVFVRDIPVGGNHFTKALTTEMQLTFAKAEHLKRNANQSTDKKALFQSMRSVFSALVEEIQRTIRFYISLDRYAKIDKMIGFGNGIHLAGLRKYLEQNLGISVEIADKFANINVTEIENNPTFKENFSTFAVCSGLCLQGLGQSSLVTNLIPREVIHARIINSKKPWMIAATALMMLGATISYGSHVMHWQTSENKDFAGPVATAQSLTSQISQFQTQADEALKQYADTKQIGTELLSKAGRSIEWLELQCAIASVLPSDPEDVNVQDIPIQRRNEVQIVNFEAQPFTKVELWKEYVTKAGYLKEKTPAVTEDGTSADGATDGSADSSADSSAEDSSGDSASTDTASETGDSEQTEGATPKTWLIQITGYHYHNRLPSDLTVAPEGANFVRVNVIKQLQEGRVKLALPPTFKAWVKEQTALLQAQQKESGEEVNEDGTPVKPAKYEVLKGPDDDKDGVWYTMEQMGITCPVLLDVPEWSEIKEEVVSLYADKEDEQKSTGRTAVPANDAHGPVSDHGEVDKTKDKTIKLNKYQFVIQFLWTPTDPLQREIARQAEMKKQRDIELKKKKEAEEAKAQAEENGENSEDSENSEDNN